MAPRWTRRLATHAACAVVGALLHAAWSHRGPVIAEASASGEQTRPTIARALHDERPAECPSTPELVTCPRPPTCPPGSSLKESSPSDPPSRGATDPPGEPPALPLSGMPGRRSVFTDARWDAADRSWLLVDTSDVPVRRSRATRFYEKAIQGLGMKLIRLPDVDDDGAVRSTIRGRMPKAHVQISLRQAPDEVLTRVRVLWRVWD